MTELNEAQGSTRRRRFQSRGRIFVAGALAALWVVTAGLVVVNPLQTTRGSLRRIADAGVPLLSQLTVLRTSVVEWQIYIENARDSLAPGVAPDAVELIKGGQLNAAQTAAATALARQLRGAGFTADAGKLDAAMKAFTTALTPLTPVASGQLTDAAKLRGLISAERFAIGALWTVTTQIAQHLTASIADHEAKLATDELTLSLRLLLTAVSISVCLIFGAALIAGWRAGHRERDSHDVGLRHAYENRLQEALEMTKTEPEVYAILGEALHEVVPRTKTEMLIADSSRAHFRRALTNGGEFEGCAVVSPLECPAATVGHALVFPSSHALNACPYLKGRASGACSAACLPVSIAGRTVGVTHAVGPEGAPPSPTEIETLNFTSRRGSERIAMIRAFATSQTQAQTDPLTGLLNRRSLENKVRDLREDHTPYALAYGDLDNFKKLNDTHGHEAGDQALRLFAQVLVDSLRPNDIAARYGGEEFVTVLPDCSASVAAGILERVRVNLALAHTAGRGPAFTVTFGVASSLYADEFDEVVAVADRALLAAKAAGRNRVGVAELPEPTDKANTST